MTRQIEGLWIGGAVSVEAAEAVQAAICYHLEMDEVWKKLPDKVKAELTSLECAIRAQCQKAEPEPPKPDPRRYL
jgi:hypothetical protein